MSNLPPNPYDRTVIVEPHIDNPDRANTAGSGRNFVVSLNPPTVVGREMMFLASDGRWVPFTTTEFTSWGGIIGNIEDQADLMAMFALYAPIADLAPVAFSGVYNDLTGKPALGNVAFINTTGDTSRYLRADGTWQIPVDVFATWGNITGLLSNQTDLQTALNAKAPINAPVFVGATPRVTTPPPLNDSSDKVATTGWFFGQAFNASPLMDGLASSGDSTLWARGNHVHPTDTTRAPLVSPVFTGNPTAPTVAQTNKSQTLATTQYVADAILGAGLVPPPSDGKYYAMRNGVWVAIDVATKWDSTGAG